MAVLPVQLIAPTFPEGYCPANIQQFANDLQSGTQLSSPITLDTVIISDTAPDDHSKLWFKTSGGAPFTYPSIPLYFWHPVLGAWVAAHKDEPGDQKWQEFTQESDIWSYQGGDGSNPAVSVPTASTGSFWEVDPRYNGRSPMSPGSIPDANPAKTLGYGENFGEGAHLQDREEVGPHDHPLTADSSIVDGNEIKMVNSGTGSAGIMIGLTGPPSTNLSVEDNEFTTSQQKMPVISPVRGQSCIIRTARLYYVG